MADKFTSKNFPRTCLSIAVAIAMTSIACRSWATTHAPLKITNKDVVIDVYDGELNINSTGSDNTTPIFF